MSCNCIKKFWVGTRSTILKVHNPKSPLLPPPPPPSPDYTSKEVDRPPHFETAPRAVRVKGGMSLRNDIIMQNLIYAEWLKK